MKNGKLHCYKSISMLEKRCKIFFQNHDISDNPHFVDAVHDASELFDGEESCDIVFFGGMIRRLSELDKWNFKKARLWVLSTTYQKILTEIYKLPKEKVGIIPRMELTKTPIKYRDFPLKSEKLNLIYSGRLSRTKNIELLLMTVSFMQTKLNLDVGLTLYGGYDDEINLNSRPIKRESYKTVVDNAIKELRWTEVPIFKGEVGEQEWIKDVREDAVLINLSTLLQEDFGVSVAQWNELGNPLIISNWGGHMDVSGENCLTISSALIPHHDSSQQLKRTMAKLIAKRIHNRTIVDIENKRYINFPNYINKSSIVESCKGIKNAIGPHYKHIKKGEWELLCTERNGQRFIYRVERCFTPTTVSKKIIISNWLSSDSRFETEYAHKVIEKNLDSSDEFEIIYFRDIHHSLLVKKLLLCNEIIIPYYIIEMEKWIIRLVNEFNVASKISITLHPKQLYLIDKLRGILRDRDNVSVYVP